jgi:hypothetical protein
MGSKIPLVSVNSRKGNLIYIKDISYDGRVAGETFIYFIDNEALTLKTLSCTGRNDYEWFEIISDGHDEVEA